MKLSKSFATVVASAFLLASATLFTGCCSTCGHEEKACCGSAACAEKKVEGEKCCGSAACAEKKAGDAKKCCGSEKCKTK